MLAFFLIVNLNHFWEREMGIWAFPVFIFLSIIFLGLTIICLSLIRKGFKEKFTNQNRNWATGIMIVGLGLIFFKPNGLVNFNKQEGIDLFIVQREGAANCRTTFKIKPNNKFKETSVCFGVSEVSGNYEVRNDTLFFSVMDTLRNNEAYYEFGILQQSKHNDEIVLSRYRNKNDTIGHELWIIQNNLF